VFAEVASATLAMNRLYQVRSMQWQNKTRTKILILGLSSLFLVAITIDRLRQDKSATISGRSGTQPLVMKGGDPYIRALMRTISAAEANVAMPYNVLYGGTFISNLSQHPQRCIPIVTGPNIGDCSTAAGRYQFINTTWYEKARLYHPNVERFLWWKDYSFEPRYQDAVVYGWLKDSRAWGVNLSQLLQQGKLDRVLRLLSPTWTSLGYGIEDNSMSSQLPKIYRQMLTEELQPTKSTKLNPQSNREIVQKSSP
jgi:muramidase (phage lysozyme)